MRKNISVKLFALMTALLCLGLFSLSPKAALAANPTTINFQGKIVNFTGGTNISDGTYSIVFRLYNTASPTMTTSCTSTATCAWQETQGSVSVTSGVFQVELGSACALTSSSCNNSAFVTANGGAINFSTNNALYLTLQFSGDSSGSNGGFMFPLMHMTSVPYAYNADNLGGIAASGFIQNRTSVQAANFFVQSANSGSIAGIVEGAASQSVDILDVDASGVGTPLFGVGSGGLITMQPAASLTSGQTAFAQTLTAGQASGTVSGHSLTITVAPSGAATSNGINLSLSDATTLANTTNGIIVTLTNTGAAIKTQTAINATLTDNAGSGASTNKAVLGTAGGTNNSAVNYGGYFSLGGGAATSSAIFGTNGTATGNILELQDATGSATDVLTLADGGALTVTPKGNNIGTIIRQTSGTATSGNVFDVQTANGTSHFITIANSATNEGAVTVQSIGATRDLTIDSGSGTLKFGSNTTVLQKTASTFALDLTNGASNSTLTISNTGGAGNIILNLDSGGNYAVGGTNGSTISACGASNYIASFGSTGGLVTGGSCSTIASSNLSDAANIALLNAANTFAPTGNNIGNIFKQTSGTATSGNVFDIQTQNGTSHFLQITNAAANEGNVTLQSVGATRNLTLDSSNGTLVLGANTTTLQKAATLLTLDVSNASNSTLSVTNSGGGTASISIQTGGSYTGAGAVTLSSAAGTALTVDSGTVGNLLIGTSGNAKAISIGNSQSGTTLGLTTGAVVTTQSNTGLNIQTNTNTATAFQVQNAGGAQIFDIDTTDTNMMTNPGFEQTSQTAWVAKGTTTFNSRDTTQNYVGAAAGKITSVSAGNDGIKQLINLVNGTTYTLSAYVLASGSNFSTLTVGYSNDGATETNFALTGQSAVINGWTRITYTFAMNLANTNGSSYIYIKDGTPAHVWWVDAVQLQTGTLATPYGGGSLSWSANIVTPVNFQSDNASTAFQVTNSTGINILNIDTVSSNQNNIVTNPSFETAGTTGWAAKGTCTGGLLQDSTNGYNGASAAKCVTGAVNSGFSYSSALSTSTAYTLSVYVKSSAFMTTLNIGHDDTNGTDVDCLTAQTMTTLGWKRYTCSFVTAASAPSPNIYVKQTDATARTLWIDAVLLQTDANADTNYRDGRISFGNATISSPIVFQTNTNSTTALQVQNAAGVQVFNIDTAGDTNLIGNPGFEVNSQGWALNGSASALQRDTSKSYVGIASGKFTSTTGSSDGIKFAVSLTTGANYALSFYVQTSAADATMTAGRADNGATNTACTLAPTVSATVPSTSGWTRFTCNFTAGTVSGSPYIYIFTGNQTTGTAVTLNIDSVKLEQVATSTTPASAYGAANISFNGVFATPVAIRNPNNNTTEFQVQNSGSTNLFTIDSLNNILQVGSTTTDATAIALVLDSYNTAADPVGAAINGAMYYNTGSNTFRCRQNGIWRNCIESPSNASTADQAVPAATLTYLTNSGIAIPAGGVRAGTQFVWRMSLTKTAAGTLAPTFAVVFGTNGTTGDTARASFTLPVETAAIDTAQITIICTVRSVSATATISCNLQLVHNDANAVGFVGTATSGSIVLTVTSGTFDDTVANSIIGLTLNSNTAEAFTFQQIQAQSINL